RSKRDWSSDVYSSDLACGRGSASTAGNVPASRYRVEVSARSAAVLLPPQRGLHPGVEPELQQGVGEMGLHRRDLDEEPRGDLLRSEERRVGKDGSAGE